MFNGLKQEIDILIDFILQIRNINEVIPSGEKSLIEKLEEMKLNPTKYSLVEEFFTV